MSLSLQSLMWEGIFPSGTVINDDLLRRFSITTPSLTSEEESIVLEAMRTRKERIEEISLSSLSIGEKDEFSFTSIDLKKVPLRKLLEQYSKGVDLDAENFSILLNGYYSSTKVEEKMRILFLLSLYATQENASNVDPKYIVNAKASDIALVQMLLMWKNKGLTKYDPSYFLYALINGMNIRIFKFVANTFDEKLLDAQLTRDILHSLREISDMDLYLTQFVGNREKYDDCLKDFTSIDVEYHNWELTQSIYKLALITISSMKLPENVQAKLEYEFRNILERWLLTLAQKGESNESPLFTPNKVADTKMISELKEKMQKIAHKSVDEISNFIDIAVATIKISSEGQPSIKRIFDTSSQLEYGKFSTSVTPRSLALVKRYGRRPVLRSALRYDAILSGSQHWGLPQEHYDNLFEIGVNREAFASPFNSRFIGKDGALFCSLFPDTDALFGSVGDFFSQDLKEGFWFVNPPFIESIMLQTIKKIIAALDKAHSKEDSSILFCILLPNWVTSESVKILIESIYCDYQRILKANTYKFELPNSEKIVAKVDTRYFILHSGSVPISTIAKLKELVSNI